MVFHSESKHDYHFKGTSKKLEGEFNCLGETIEKYKTFSVQTTKEGKSIFNNGKETTKIIF